MGKNADLLQRNEIHRQSTTTVVNAPRPGDPSALAPCCRKPKRPESLSTWTKLTTAKATNQLEDSQPMKRCISESKYFILVVCAVHSTRKYSKRIACHLELVDEWISKNAISLVTFCLIRMLFWDFYWLKACCSLVKPKELVSTVSMVYSYTVCSLCSEFWKSISYKKQEFGFKQMELRRISDAIFGKMVICFALFQRHISARSNGIELWDW